MTDTQSFLCDTCRDKPADGLGAIELCAGCSANGQFFDYLREKIERLEIENQLWRESIATMRDVAVNLSPVVAHCQSLEVTRDMMAQDDTLKQMVDDRLELERARAQKNADAADKKALDVREAAESAARE